MLNKIMYENGNGGQTLIRSNDVQTTRSLFPMVYIRLFGGNREGNTSINRLNSELNKGWWGNSPTNKKDWINSDTERLLKGISTTYANKKRIEDAIKRDLKDLQQYGKQTIEVTYPSLNRVSMYIQIARGNSTEKYSILWDATINEVIEQVAL